VFSLLGVLHPLGLQATRLAAVRGVATDFLATSWSQPSDFKHCGRFVCDSWRIFCCGQRSAAGVEDKNLLRYLRWLLHGRLDEGLARSKEGAPAASKRSLQPPVQAGTLRSGRRRNGGAGAAGKAKKQAAAGERRMTRSAAAAASARPRPGLASKL
jgi:hypothetical protein